MQVPPQAILLQKGRFRSVEQYMLRRGYYGFNTFISVHDISAKKLNFRTLHSINERRYEMSDSGGRRYST